MHLQLTVVEIDFIRSTLDALKKQMMEWTPQELALTIEPYLSVRFKILREPHHELEALRHEILKTGIIPILPESDITKRCPTCNGTKFVKKVAGMGTETVKCPTCNHNFVSGPATAGMKFDPTTGQKI